MSACYFSAPIEETPMPVFESPKVRLHYDDVGSGPPALFLQGVGIGRQGWAPQTRALAAHFAAA